MMIPSGFEDHLILWSIAIGWLQQEGGMDPNCNYIVCGDVAGCCYLTQVCTFSQLPDILLKPDNIVNWVFKKSKGNMICRSVKEGFRLFEGLLKGVGL